MKTIAVNGRFLSQPMTGVQRYGHEFLREVDCLLSHQASPRLLRVELLVPRDSIIPGDLKEIVVRRVGRLTGQAWEQWDLPVAAASADVLFCPSNLAPLRTLILGRTPVVTTIHDVSYRQFPEAYSRAFRLWYNFLTPIIVRRSEALLTVSEAERRNLVAFFPDAEDRLFAVANGGLPREITGTQALPPSVPKPYVLYAGSLSERKNFQGVMAAAQIIHAQRPLTFVFGGGRDRSFSDARAIGENPQMLFLGQVNDTESLAALYRNATCFVFPSFYESSGLPPVEAMSMGCPVVASDIPALRERCGDAALYCDPNDAGSIARAILAVCDDAVLRENLIAKGRARAAAFSWEACARHTLPVLYRAAHRSEISLAQAREAIASAFA